MAAHKGNKYALLRDENPTYTDKQIEALGEELIEWADTSESLHFVDFCLKHQRDYSWICKLAERNKKFSPYYESAKVIMGKKIVNLSFFNPKVNAYVGMKYLSRYDADYKRLLDEEAARRKMANESGFKNVADFNAEFEEFLNNRK